MRPFDRKWRRRLKWTLDALEDRNMQRIDQMQHDLHCGVITYLAGAKVLSTHWEQATDLQSRMMKRLFPWLNIEDRTTAYQQLTDLWEHYYGKMSDPETQRKIEEAVTKLRRKPTKQR